MIAAAVALLAWLWLIAFRGRFWQAGPILPAMTPERAPPVDVVVPARDEAEVVARSIGSLLAQDYAGRLRVVLVDDDSGDRTAEIARGLPGTDRLVVIRGAPRPRGWAGKLWAVHQGVAETDAPLVLLTDADIVHDPAHVATLVAQAERSGADLVSEMVALNCTSIAERALVPAFVYFFALLYPFAWVNDGLRATAAAAGGTVLIRRPVLERIGGIAAIRGALIDDVALAASVKRGGRLWLGHSALARSIRPYPRFADIWRMVARSAYVQLRLSPVLLVGMTVGLALLFLVPPAAAIFGGGSTRWLGLAAWALMAASFLPTLRRFRLSPLWAPILPAIACFYMAATIGSAVDHHRGRGVVWKQRAYTERQA
ncbi:MAG TPA: glycosyltransferase [Acetobacteraceae bacterium]|nr:glycosyltransferase [Acetobacteraceae bacterium]